MRSSKYLKREDVGRGVLLTIKGVHEEDLALEGKPPEMKWVMSFAETEKPMVVNTTNLHIMAQFLSPGDPDPSTDDWIGKQVVLYDDPNITFQGKLVGGIRCRAPRIAPKAQPALAKPAPAPLPQEDPGQDPNYDPEINF